MKKLLIATLFASAFAMTPTVRAADAISLRICEYVSVNDKKRLRSFLKSNKLKLRNIFKNIRCNDQNLLVFAASSNALDVGELLIGKLSKKIVRKNIEAVAAHSKHLEAKIKRRIK
ncbi:MAG: hypothetical protein COB35_11600 [Gammaproteobacteria bacterium]|nr:MAG: hypothetical protein COB35_11600 [Gammaproteobacteria bacterium]